MTSLCRMCAYEYADCKGNKDLEKLKCDYYKKPIVMNVKDLAERVAELEIKLKDAVQGWRIGKPTEKGKYVVTLDTFGHKHIDLFYYGKPLMPNRKVRGKCWYRSDDEWGDVVYDDKDILAWMPLPKPYREDGEV